MGYYMGGRGDFYRGARGDPGFFSFLGGIAKKALGFIPGVGPVLSAGVEAATAGTARASTPSLARQAGRIVGAAGAVAAKHPVLSAAGAAGVAMVGTEAVSHALGAPAGAKGFHVSKKSGKLVRNRHMRVTNPRALRRSLRRVAGFSRMARKVMHFTHPGHKGRLRFKFPKRRKAA